MKVRFRVKLASLAATPVTWRCFQCGNTVLQPASYVTRDGGSWCTPPADWLFVADNDELTFVCSLICLKAIYANDT
jgi:hypothetical protein